MIKKIIKFFRNWFLPRKTEPEKEGKENRHVYSYETCTVVSSMSEVPMGGLGNKIFLVNRGGINRWVIFDCPGGHGRRIQVNLMKSRTPYWEISINNGKITLYPSIDVAKDVSCDCHFFLTDNTVQKGRY